MKNSTKFAFTTLAATMLFGTAGAVGTSAASADTIEQLTPDATAGAYCVVLDDNGDEEEFLFSPLDCSSAQSEIDREERREERREELRDAE